MVFSKMNAHSPHRRPGFTLIELLTVIAIITVLAGIVVAGVGAFGGASVPAAQRSLGGMIDVARTTAQLRQTNAYLLIYADEAGDPNKYLRFVGVVYEDPDTGALIPTGNGTYLAGDSYIIPGNVPVKLTADLRDDAPAIYLSELDSEFPVAFPNRDGTPESWYAIGFDNLGQTTTTGPGGAGGLERAPVIVLAPGVVVDNTGTAALEVSDPFAARGIFVRPNGNTIMMNDFQEIADAL